MFSKIALLACVLAVANAGNLGVPAIASYAAPAYTSYAAPAYTSYAAPAYTSYAAPTYAHGYAEPTLSATSENTYRSAGNLHTISTQSKSISTPYSSSNKHFTSVTNPGVYAHAAPVAYAAAPVAHATYAAAPVAHATYAAAPIAHTTYAAAAPVAVAAPVAHTTYAAAAPIATTYAAGHSYGAGLVGRSAHPSSLLGVAYSPAVAVSHMSYSSPVGINYGW